MSVVPSPRPDDEFLQHLPLIEQVIGSVTRRYHMTATEAEDFASHVKLELFKNDCSTLRKYEGRSSVRTYLTVVVSRLCLDYRTRAWGKWRPSAEARRGGPVAMRLEQLLTRDGLSFDEACQILATNHLVTLERAELERLAGAFPVRLKRRFESEDLLGSTAAPDRTPEEVLEEQERLARSARVSTALRKVMAGLEPQDRLILSLHFRDGRKVSEIAALLRLEQKPLYRRLERILSRLRAALKDEGVDGLDVVPLLQ